MLLLIVSVLAWTGAAEANAQEAAVMPAATKALAPSSVEGLRLRRRVPLEFSRAWLRKTDAVIRRRAELDAAGELEGVSPAELAKEGAALAGELRVPVVLVRYANVPAPFPARVMADRLFGASQGDTVSYADYWREASGGLLRVRGMVTSWVRLPESASHYLPGRDYGWGHFGRVAELRQEALKQADRAIDFSQFDNDGPDGIPNSGDDDGYVDFVAFFYATRCDRQDGAIWPHRGAMAPYVTNDAAANGGFIKITDYVILPAISPATCGPSHIGVLAHETAHALGLPDLYDYDGSSKGIGAWGLMGTGSRSTPHSPAHPSAWVREQLGWAREDSIAVGDSASIAADSGAYRLLRADLGDGTGRYLLMEDRVADSSDRDIPGHGLLVWAVDPERTQMGAWNGDERRPAIALLARDSAGLLALVDGADDNGPFPGRGVPAEAPRLPVALDELSDAAGIHVRLRAAGHPTWERGTLDLATTVGGPAVGTEVDVRGAPADSVWRPRTAAPWLSVQPVAGGVRLVADGSRLDPGEHEAPVELVDARTGRVEDRLTVKVDVAAPGHPAVVDSALSWSWGLAIAGPEVVRGGTGRDAVGFYSFPRLMSLPRDGGFVRTLARLPAQALFAPTPAPGGGVYVLARARTGNYVYRVDPDGSAAVIAALPVDGPAYGLTTLPDGSLLVAEWRGRLMRIAPDGTTAPWLDLNQSVYQIAADRDGRIYASLFSGDVARIDPDGSVRRIHTGFDRGRLVAVTVAPDGRAYAAERGGKGRILELRDHGVRTVARVRGGEFYGLAADRLFLYAADLGHGELLRLARAQAPAVLAGEPAPAATGGTATDAAVAANADGVSRPDAPARPTPAKAP